MNLKPEIEKETDRLSWEERFDICFPVNQCDFSEDSEKIKNFIKKYFVYMGVNGKECQSDFDRFIKNKKDNK